MPAAPLTFDAAYQQELSYVWRTLGRLGVPHADLSDATHDVFIVVYRLWAERDAERPLRPWLFAIARKHAATRRRKRREELRDDLDATATPPSDHIERDLVWRALALLDEDRRDAIILHDLDGCTAPEIAAALDVPLNTIYSRIRLGRADFVAAVRRLEGAP
ncbi:MAG TPA: sigma-70 family RNA polymerase sigma factor [Kofleriaceae bacterium]|jgi:RNA polymerase sigma-70 factor (ECF subfamily)